VLRAVVLTQYRRLTDGETDGIGVASTVLAKRSLRRAVKSEVAKYYIPKTPHEHTTQTDKRTDKMLYRYRALHYKTKLESVSLSCKSHRSKTVKSNFYPHVQRTDAAITCQSQACRKCKS